MIVGVQLVLTFASLALLTILARRARGTTLIAPAVWSGVAITAVSCVELVLSLGVISDHSTAGAMQLGLAALVLCPQVAVLGAKRPQNKAWQWIVASLWLVLALPAGEWLLLNRSPGELHPARAWFLAILWGMGVINYLGTRFWPSGLLASAAQLLVVGPLLPWPLHLDSKNIRAASPQLAEHLGLAALAAIAISLAVVATGWPRRREERNVARRLWQSFRDAYGMLWALRIAERVCAASNDRNRQIAPSLSGFVAIDGRPLDDLPPELQQSLQSELRALLRRFVSEAWLERAEGS